MRLSILQGRWPRRHNKIDLLWWCVLRDLLVGANSTVEPDKGIILCEMISGVRSTQTVSHRHLESIINDCGPKITRSVTSQQRCNVNFAISSLRRWRFPKRNNDGSAQVRRISARIYVERLGKLN